MPNQTLSPSSKTLLISRFRPSLIKNLTLSPPNLNLSFSPLSPTPSIQTPIPSKTLTLSTYSPQISYSIKTPLTKNFSLISFAPEIYETQTPLPLATALSISYSLSNNFWEFFFSSDLLNPFARLDRAFPENFPTPTELTILKVLEFYQKTNNTPLIVEISGNLFSTYSENWQIIVLEPGTPGTVGYPPHH